jgi:SagB-type dehydrogenase family enzyme
MATHVTEWTREDLPASRKVVWEYHARTKHGRTAYALGPETLDWDAQPSPWRSFAGARIVQLPWEEDADLSTWLERPFPSLSEPPEPATPSLASLGALLHLSFGITAWKTFGPDRWAVRANPSSGNLHPVEAYVVVQHFAGLAPGVYHYRPEDHALECRADFGGGDAAADTPRLAVGLSTVMWREAWKYGERAFRYCELDTGHAVGALHYAAATLGWKVAEQAHIGAASVAHALGLDRTKDFSAGRRLDTEREEPELMLSLSCEGREPPPLHLQELRAAVAGAHFTGVASVIDPHPMYRWPVLDEVAEATRAGDGMPPPRRPMVASTTRREPTRSAADVILGRRSAQRFDSGFWLNQDDFFGLLECVVRGFPRPLARTHRVDLVLFAHRVEGLDPGVYLLTRPGDGTPLAARMASRFDLPRVAQVPASLDLRRVARLEQRPLARLAREVHCRQDIAAQACFVAGLVVEFEAVIEADPAAYRSLHREAGLLGHTLYLEAEARGLGGTGIGCFLDDVLHELLELSDTRFQTLYHFAVGRAIDDTRIETTATRCPGLRGGQPR